MSWPKDVFPIDLNGVTKAVILKCQNGLILVDTGLNADHAEIVLKFARGTLDMPLENFGKLCLITHSHTDHIGGLAQLVKTCQF